MRRITMLAMVAVLALMGAAWAVTTTPVARTRRPATTAITPTTAGPLTTAAMTAATPARPISGTWSTTIAVPAGGAFLNPMAAATPGADVDFDETSEQLQAIAEAAPEEIQDAMACSPSLRRVRWRCSRTSTSRIRRLRRP